MSFGFTLTTADPTAYSLSLLYVCDVWVSTAAAAVHTRCRLLACFYPSRSNVAAIWELYDLFKPNGNYLIVLWFSQKISATTKVPILHLLFTADCERIDSFRISFAAITCPFLHVRALLSWGSSESTRNLNTISTVVSTRQRAMTTYEAHFPTTRLQITTLSKKGN